MMLGQKAPNHDTLISFIFYHFHIHSTTTIFLWKNFKLKKEVKVKENRRRTYTPEYVLQRISYSHVSRPFYYPVNTFCTDQFSFWYRSSPEQHKPFPSCKTTGTFCKPLLQICAIVLSSNSSLNPTKYCLNPNSASNSFPPS